MLEAHFFKIKITSHQQTPRMSEACTASFVGIDEILYHRDSSIEMFMVKYFKAVRSCKMHQESKVE